ncbi:hypothetical protein DFH07DRAFT_929071 [Mycena maculata]|uniref:BTB domain-containing protein n=1 Tax=Mycena maculata TaxID=230809 RepID=A0AAD7MTT9_9AGAR|nr:hypothetical protein DFH07DRAFT_929071 [Mycena maculata]
MRPAACNAKPDDNVSYRTLATWLLSRFSNIISNSHNHSNAALNQIFHVPLRSWAASSLRKILVMAAPQKPNSKTIGHERNTPCAPTLLTPTYNEAFSSSEADIVLESSDGTLYRVHSYTLRTTSGLFRTMLSLPPPSGGHTHEPIAIHHPDAVVEPLLRLICGLATRPWRSIDELEAVLTLAESWDAPGPISSLRIALSGGKWLTTAPLRLYALAAHFAWPAEAQRASTHTLVLDLSSPAHAPVLASLPAPALLALLRLHRTRRDALRALLDSPERFLAGNGDPFHCSACAVTPLDNRTWRALKARIFREMNVRPLGDTLGVPVGGMCDWPEAKACWAARCAKEGCGAANYDRAATLKQVRTCVDALPLVVELDWMD